jgi:SAM-dependent methyltransferase
VASPSAQSILVLDHSVKNQARVAHGDRDALRSGPVPSPGPSRRFFDAWSLVYDLPLVQWLTYRPVQDAVVATLRGLRPRRGLDVGCGTGLLATRLRRELDGAAVVGCDFSQGMLAQARAHPEAVGWVRGDALRLPLRTATIDAVVSTEAFHWFPDQARAVAEFARVLVPGGHAIVALVTTPNEAVRAAFRLGSRTIGQPFDWPTRADLRALFEAAGFRVEAQRRVFRIPAGLLLPPVMTVARRAAPQSP